MIHFMTCQNLWIWMNKESSRHLKSIVIRLCEATTRYDHVLYDEDKLDGLFSTYELIRDSLRESMRDNDKLDRHKIAALLTIAFLFHNPFDISSDNASPAIRNIKYIIALKIGVAILASFKNVKSYDVDISYSQEFVRLLQNNRELFNNIASSQGQNSIQSVFFLSHIYYFIEKCEQIQH